MDESILMAALAGLLHDMGKIAQRASKEHRVSVAGFVDDGQPAHSTHSARFIQSYVPATYRAALAGAYHHAPERFPEEDKRLCKLIALADKLSTGEKVEASENKTPPRKIISIFDRVALTEPRRKKEWHFLPIRPLKLSQETLFPNGDKDDGEYQALLETLIAVASQDTGDLQSYVENLLGALQISAWCVPSAYYHSAPDVSLYDHSRMTAALAVCMAETAETEIDSLLKDFQKDEKLPDTPLALLVGGDISGIQNFIYTITSKKAAQTLRGRSFYLQMLTEAVLHFVLAELDLPATNVIYSGGGHFFLLAPLSAKDKLPDIRFKVTTRIHQHHGTDLYFGLGSADVPVSGFMAGEFPKYWNQMHTDLGLAKQRRYTELDTELYKTVFAIPDYGGNPDDTCSVCGSDRHKTKPFVDHDERQARSCTLCDSFWEEVGKHLPDAKFVALGWQKPQDTQQGTLADALMSFGMQFKIVKNEKDILLERAERISLLALDDPAHGYPTTGTIPTTRTLRYTVNDIPRADFDELQKMVEGGFERLGVLRMDVDNLGDIFKKGLGEFATLARISTLSFQMSLFFEGWVKRICDDPMFKGKIYSVYAGGDDVFLVGPWDVMPELALRIRDDFAKYTADHPDLHISAGLAFIGGKYPIYQAAEDAEAALKMAKNSIGKNSFGFLGQAWSWTEFAKVQEKFEQLVNIMDDKKLNGPQALAQVLQNLAETKKKQAEKMKTRDVWGAWQWRGAYFLKRMAEREKKQPELVKEIESIYNDLEPSYSNIHQWGTAARWAQLKTRKKKQTEGS